MPKLDKSQPLTFLSPLFKEHRGIDKGGDKAVTTRNMNEITTVASVFSALLPPSRALLIRQPIYMDAVDRTH